MGRHVMHSPRKMNVFQPQIGRATQKRVLVLSVTVLSLTHNRQRCAAKALRYDCKAVKEKLNPVLRGNPPACSDVHDRIGRPIRCLRKARRRRYAIRYHNYLVFPAIQERIGRARVGLADKGVEPRHIIGRSVGNAPLESYGLIKFPEQKSTWAYIDDSHTGA